MVAAFSTLVVSLGTSWVLVRCTAQRLKEMLQKSQRRIISAKYRYDEQRTSD